MMTCTQVAENCSAIFGTRQRFAFSYDDLKAANASRRGDYHDAHCRQMALETPFVPECTAVR